MRMIIVLFEIKVVLLPVSTFTTNVEIFRIGFKYINIYSEEFQTDHYQSQSTNIGNKFRTDKLRMENKSQAACSQTESNINIT
jgi:hypothetical protein